MTRWPGLPVCPARHGARPRKAWNVARSWSRWHAPATRPRWPARRAANRPAAQPARARWPCRSSGSSAVPQCRWCSTPAPDWRCSHCNGTRLRRGATGALRTAEELGRAFPGKAVVTSSGDHVKATVAGRDGTGRGHRRCRAGRRRRLRGRPAARRRFAAPPGKPAGRGGRSPALVQCRCPGAPGQPRAAWWSSRPTTPLPWAPCCAGTLPATRSVNWHCGRSCSLPPAVRVASVTGRAHRRRAFHRGRRAAGVTRAAGAELRSAGPAPLCSCPRTCLRQGRPAQRGRGEDVRTLLFHSRTARRRGSYRCLRAVKAASAAKRSEDPVQLRLDGVDVL